MQTIKFKKDKLPLVIRTQNKYLKASLSDVGEIVFTDMTCAHRGAPLSHGEVVGKYIVCPWHKRKAEVCKLKTVELAYRLNDDEFSVDVPEFQQIVTKFTA
jgi:hypothetical protein